MIRFPARTAALAIGLLALSACGPNDARRILGMDKATPDEFKIVSRAPLSLPPDYALRPPAPGTQRPQEMGTPQRALAAVTGGSAQNAGRGASTPAGSAGENALLARMGAERANPGIRDVLEREYSSLADADTTLLDQLIFWRGPEDRSPVVDAQRESQRLRENASLGRGVNEGDTPSIRRRKKALFEGIF